MNTPEKSRQSALKAKEYAQKFKLKSTTHHSFAQLSLDEQLTIDRKCAEVRSTRDQSPSTILGLDRSYNNFVQLIDNSKNSQHGNCVESALLALDYIIQEEPHTRAEVFMMPKIDHVFSVINRSTESNTTDPSTWGECAYVCDPWEDTVYPASELCKKREYQFSTIISEPTEDNRLQVRAVQHPVTYDPKEETITISDEFTTDHIRPIASQEHINAIVDIYQERSAKVISALEKFSKDLEGLKGRLNENNPKHGVISNKLDAVKTEIDRIKQEKESKIPDDSDYRAMRSELANKMQQSLKNAEDITTFNETEQQTLQTKRFPVMDRIMGKTNTTSWQKANESTIETKALLAQVSQNKAQQKSTESKEKSPSTSPNLISQASSPATDNTFTQNNGQLAPKPKPTNYEKDEDTYPEKYRSNQSKSPSSQLDLKKVPDTIYSQDGITTRLPEAPSQEIIPDEPNQEIHLPSHRN